MAIVTQKHIEEVLSNTKYEINHKVFDRTCILAGKLPNGAVIISHFTFQEGDEYSENKAMEIVMAKFTEKVLELESYKLSGN